MFVKQCHKPTIEEWNKYHLFTVIWEMGYYFFTHIHNVQHWIIKTPHMGENSEIGAPVSMLLIPCSQTWPAGKSLHSVILLDVFRFPNKKPPFSWVNFPPRPPFPGCFPTKASIYKLFSHLNRHFSRDFPKLIWPQHF